ncbi:MAG TPA: CRTAC1 family protein [Capsulimonadaceae bacterium]|nr:CRTAC1 family protein [Capsulimonadaceae bacterium]
MSACFVAGCHQSSDKASGSANSSGGSVSPFVDIASQAGLNYRWAIDGKRPINILQSIGNGCAFLDYNNDGNLDILFVGDKLALYKGDGHGHFTDVTQEMGLSKLHGHYLGCAVGDYDNDGYDDIYISGYGAALLLHNQGGNGFKDVTAQSGLKPQPWGSSCAWVDIDGDGKLDLYVGNYVRFGPDTKPQLCDQEGVQTACGPRQYQGIKGVLYHNLGSGKFEDVTQKWHADHTPGYTLGVAAADYNGSGRQSLALANDENPGDLLTNQGKVFQDEGEASGTALDAAGEVHGGMGIDWGDYDNDGQLDLFVATFQHQAKCLYHNEGAYFTEKSSAMGLGGAVNLVTFGCKWIDYDNTGWLDLILANGHVQDNIQAIDKSESYREPIALYRNQMGRSFQNVGSRLDPKVTRPIVGRGLAVGDFDNDGRMDVLVVDCEGAPLLLHNQSPNPGHWLELNLIGTRSNRDGLGAIVTATAGGLKQVRPCQTDGSYMSASDKRVHIGLGTAATADISIRWPSGQVDQYTSVNADHIITAREGSKQLITH